MIWEINGHDCISPVHTDKCATPEPSAYLWRSLFLSRRLSCACDCGCCYWCSVGDFQRGQLSSDTCVEVTVEGGLAGGRLSRPGGSNCQPVEGVSPFHVEGAAEEGRWARGRFRQRQVAVILLVGARARENGRAWRATPKLFQMSPARTQTILRVVSTVTLFCLPLCPFSIWRHMVSLGNCRFRG
jgi:hypothetical protein